MAKYTHIYVYEKTGNLLDYYKSKGMLPNGKTPSNDMLRERNLQLRVYIRRESKVGSWGEHVKPHIFCLIDCPVNPMPVVGEFEVCSLDGLEAFLIRNGWHRKFIVPVK